MSLNWNITQVKDYEELQEGAAWQLTDALIWLTLTVGIPTITDANWQEFYARVHLLDLLYRSPENWIKPEDVQRRIGLTTNVSSLTRNQFVKRAITDRFFTDQLARLNGTY
jgi:hypothetical protein